VLVSLGADRLPRAVARRHRVRSSSPYCAPAVARAETSPGRAARP